MRKPKPDKNRSKSRAIIRVIKWAIFIPVIIFIAHQAITWPKVKPILKTNPKTTAFIELYKQKEKKAKRKPKIRWQWLPYSQISYNLKLAVLVSEDIGFFSHKGIDLAELKIAIMDSFKEKKLPRGASTITQQTAKNLWLSPNYSPLRKIKEIILAMELEYYLPKKRILEIYLNIAEFGPGIYGVQSASHYYFQKSASELNEQESAYLSAILPKPSKWRPDSKSQAYQNRVQIILERMQTATFLEKYI